MSEDDWRQQWQGIDWDVVGLQLCQCSYQPSLDTIVDSVLLVGFPKPSIFRWNTARNLCYFGSNGEAMFVAQCVDTIGNVVALAVVIRGTDFDTDVDGIFDELDYDLDLVPVTPSWLPVGTEISTGANTDYENAIVPARFDEQSLNDYIGAQLVACRNASGRYPKLLVTGHSLGGCIVSVVATSLALYLASNDVAAQVDTISYAAPTAGNEAFAALFLASCPASKRISNTLDIVPHGWAALASVSRIYDSCTIAHDAGMPEELEKAIVAIDQFLIKESITYKQPATVKHLTGKCLKLPLGLPSWTQSAAHQHHTTTYMKLLGGSNIPYLGSASPPPY